MFRMELLQNDAVRYANQPIAVVIAETLEAASEGAARLAPRYQEQPARVGLDADESFVPPAVGAGNPAVVEHGDVEAGFAAAVKAIDSTYETPAQYHNPMEPHAIVAVWDDDALSIDMPTQALAMAQARIAGLFGIPLQNIHIRSPFLGGGFGCKGLSGPQVLGIMAARLVNRPVKLVLRREHMYGPVGHRPPTRQRLRVGVDEAGCLTVLEHHAKKVSNRFDDFFEPAANASHTLYASPAIKTSHEVVRIDTGTPLFMRAPGEATGSIALESAIDEMSFACGIDPPDSGLISTGLSSGPAHRTCPMPVSPGAPPIPQQQVLPSTMPLRRQSRSPISRQATTARPCSAQATPASLPAACTAVTTERAASLMPIFSRARVLPMSKQAVPAPQTPRHKPITQCTRMARSLPRVKVDPDLGQIRVTRMVGAFAAGRIINPKLVRSQLFGGMIWGMSFALHEEAVVDRRSGRIMNPNLAEYHVPVNADVPSLDVPTVDEHDPHVNALGIKGVGEIGITGSAGAVANAVWHATGVRVRCFPIRISDLVMAL
jgi:CO/xanthine dehydrogenase Mo-binding subunit